MEIHKHCLMELSHRYFKCDLIIAIHLGMHKSHWATWETLSWSFKGIPLKSDCSVVTLTVNVLSLVNERKRIEIEWSSKSHLLRFYWEQICGLAREANAIETKSWCSENPLNDKTWKTFNNLSPKSPTQLFWIHLGLNLHRSPNCHAQFRNSVRDPKSCPKCCNKRSAALLV